MPRALSFAYGRRGPDRCGCPKPAAVGRFDAKRAFTRTRTCFPDLDAPRSLPGSSNLAGRSRSVFLFGAA